MCDMRDLQLTISREESQNNESEDMEFDNKQTDSGDTNAKLLDSRKCTEETKVNIDVLTKKENAKQRKTGLRGKKLRGWCYKAYNYLLKPVLLFVVLYLLFKDLKRETTDSPIRADNQQHTDPPPKVSALQQSEWNDSKFRPLPEEYTVDMHILHTTKDLRWITEAGNKQILTKPSTNSGCIKFKTDGKFKVFNSVTISYQNKMSIYHAVAHKRANKEGKTMSKRQRLRILKKSNFQWKTPQSGRQPSPLLFLVDIQMNDELCVQTNDISMIYAGSTDNTFLIEKLN